PDTGIAIHPNGNKNKCLDVRGASFKNGTPVQIYDCNNTPAQKWVIKREQTSIQVAGTNFCLDSSTNAASGTKMKIWQCYPGIPAQTWIYSANSNYISRLGADQCLDLTDGRLTNSNVVQTWRCSANNRNQVWTV
ncbi:carbohydrate-binding module family 13 protein, partial [Panaeolus papilionaceus]